MTHADQVTGAFGFSGCAGVVLSGRNNAAGKADRMAPVRHTRDLPADLVSSGT
jgi:hypothetical protein